MYKNILLVTAAIVAFMLLSFILFLGVATATNKRHDDIARLDIDNNQKQKLPHDELFSITTFNIGYAGLDKDQDFFADGGKKSRSESYERTMDNLTNMIGFMKQENSDFYLIQEIDTKASRSYKINQYEILKKELAEHGSTFAYNYNSIWVPAPVTRPMGYVDAGMGTFSKYEILEANRYQLRGQESWPMKVFELDRCFVEHIVPLDNGKKLVLVNLHLSAYDKGGKLRSKQVEHLIEYMNAEYQKGNYVVLGGDWNQLLTEAQMEDPTFLENWPDWLVKVPETLTATGFHWAVDPNVMTVRDLATEYIEGETFETIIDGFLVSPNIEVVSVYGHDLGFEYSDHNPVTCILRLK